MAIAAAQILPHFGDGAAAPAAPREMRFRSLAEPPAETPRPDPAVVERAVAAALEAARKEFEQQRAAEREAHEKHLAAREAEIAETTSKALAERLTTGLGELNDAIAGHAARVLLRFLDRAIRERAIGELTETVAALVVGGEAARVRVSGPADLVDRLGPALGAVASVEVQVSDAPDVSIVIDHTIIETRIGAWLEQTSRAVGGAGDV